MKHKDMTPILELYLSKLPIYVRPMQDDRGTSMGHLKWMIVELTASADFQDDKANRWFGWIQCMMAMYGFRSLQDMRNDVSRRKIQECDTSS